MGGHWTTITPSQVLWSVRSHDPIATTWSISPLRKRRSNPIQWHHRWVQEEEVRRCFAMATWRLDINSGRRRRSQAKISMLHETKLLQTLLVPSSNSRTFRRYSRWSYIAWQCAGTGKIYRVHLPRREREWVAFHNQKRICARRKKPQVRKTSGILHCSEPDGWRFWHGANSMRSYETKDRAIQEYKETPWNHSIVVQFEVCSRERIAILPDTVTCSRSRLHTACSLQWESVMYETTDELYQKVRLTPRAPRVVLKSNSQHGPQDPQSQDARSSWETSSDSKSYGWTCNNTVDHRILGVPLSTVEQQNTTRENKVKRLIEKFENQKQKESFIQDLRQTEKINKFSRESQDLIADLKHRDLRTLRKFFQTAMSWVQYLLENRYNLLQLWRKCEIFEETNRVREQRRRHLNPWLCYQEKQQPWSQARTFWTTKNVVPGETDAEKGPLAKTRTPPNDTFTMVRQWIVQKFVGEKNTECCTTESSWRSISTSQQELKEFKIRSIGFSCERRRTPATTQSTTWLSSCEKRMQTIARRAPGKDPRRIKNHSSQSTSKTAKRTTIRGRRRIWLRGRP